MVAAVAAALGWAARFTPMVPRPFFPAAALPAMWRAVAMVETGMATALATIPAAMAVAQMVALAGWEALALPAGMAAVAAAAPVLVLRATQVGQAALVAAAAAVGLAAQEGLEVQAEPRALTLESVVRLCSRIQGAAVVAQVWVARCSARLVS
jgi:hypothetical protein